MNRESIFLAGWLTTAVVAVVVIVGMSAGTVPVSKALSASTAETGVGAGPITPDAAGTVPVPSAQNDIAYVYPDGSPAPDPSTAAKVAPAGGYDDDGDRGRDDDEDEDGGWGRIFQKLGERVDDDD